MRFVPIAAPLVAAALLISAPVFAQTTPDTTKPAGSMQPKQLAQDGNPGGAGYRQKVQDGNPGGAGYRQKVQDGNSPSIVGPGSQAYKQKTQSLSHAAPEKQN